MTSAESIAAASCLSITLVLLLQTLAPVTDNIASDSPSPLTVKIAGAVKSAGYSAMSTVLLNNTNVNLLLQTDPYKDNDIITIFALRDEDLDGVDKSRVELDHQIVPFKFDAQSLQKSCSAGCVLDLPTLNIKRRLQLTVPFGREDERYYDVVELNGVRVVRWNAYNDEHVIVHGVQEWFPHRGDHWD